MLAFILRNTEFKKYSPKKQEMLVKLLGKKYLIQWICELIVFFIMTLPLITLSLFLLCEKECSDLTYIVTIIFLVLFIAFFSIFVGYFSDEIVSFIYLMRDRLFSTLYTKRGRALSKENFNTIKNNHEELYNCITSCKCHGFCYFTCFSILKTLKKGCIKFVAVINTDSDATLPYTMHVLYVQNDWAFDTFNQRQFPIDELIKIYDGIVYKEFYFEDVEGLNYEEFREKNYDEMAIWCEKHNCYQEWKEKDV